MIGILEHFSRLISRFLQIDGIFETYSLNLVRVLQSVLLAFFVPFYIGLESYGSFVFLTSLPLLFQSIFEAFCISLFSRRYRPAIFQPKYFLFAFCVKYFVLIVLYEIIVGGILAFLYATLSILLIIRSFVFANLICSNTPRRYFFYLEICALMGYVVIILHSYLGYIDKPVLPMFMIILSSVFYLFGFFYLWIKNIFQFSKRFIGRRSRAYFSLAVRSLALKSFEDLQFTFSAFLMGLLVSNSAAGFFRIYASVVKLVYMTYPLRYEFALSKRSALRGHRPAFFKLNFVLGATFFFLSPLVFFAPFGDFWVVFLLASVGTSTVALSMFPVLVAKGSGVLFGYLSVYLSGIVSLFMFGMDQFAFFLLMGSAFVWASSLRFGAAR